MDRLSNAFSLLELAADDNLVPPPPAATASRNSVQGKNKANRCAKNQQTSDTALELEYKVPLVWIDSEMTDQSKNKANRCAKNQQTSETALELEYKMPLVWIDLEMTGLNIEVDRILEIACIITDGDLAKSVEGPDLVIHQSKECLDRMGEWCQNHHEASGLTKKVLHSTLSEREAEKQVVEFVKRNVGTYQPLLAGNSVYVDFIFLKKYMPDLASLFSHVLVDVSSIKALCIRWFPRDHRKSPRKEKKHRALDDIRESISELKYYKENIFKLKSKK